ncbi:hypothetical protein ACJX0J_039725, partial [Zea mays]
MGRQPRSTHMEARPREEGGRLDAGDVEGWQYYMWCFGREQQELNGIQMRFFETCQILSQIRSGPLEILFATCRLYSKLNILAFRVYLNLNRWTASWWCGFWLPSSGTIQFFTQAQSEW